MSIERGRPVFKTADGEQVFEGTPRPADVNFKVWLNDQREGRIAYAITNQDPVEARRIGGLSDEDLAMELGIYQLPVKKDETKPFSADQKVA